MQDQRSKTLTLSLAALGVVYGDIGTSVLYAFKECLHHGLTTDREIIGVLSLIIWTLLLLVGIKYLSVIMRADNQGEGGILALLSLTGLRDKPRKGRATKIIIAVGICGAALLYGDGIITPAISVISAVEGLLIGSDSLKPYVIPLTLGILVGLFAIQSKGTGTIGRFFGPIMLVWFGTLAITGIIQITKNPHVLWALNPIEGFYFLTHHGVQGLIIMGSVFLVVTGGESIYADMGHFGRKPIALAWNCLVFPSLVLNYLGQGALVLANPLARENPFFFMVPPVLLYPMIALATAAAIIASQALISGAFSLTMQGIQMGYIPRMEILHTSKDEHGQIFIPKLNIMLAIGCMALVVSFKTSSNLVNAYGIAVVMTMIATTFLFYFASQQVWKWHPLKSAAFCLVCGSLELIFFAANSLKIPHGGWFPLVAAASIFTVMTTWKAGRELLQSRLTPGMPLDDFISSISLAGTLSEENRLHRSQGTAVFLASNPEGTPNALVKNIKHNQVVHTRNIFLTILTDKSRAYVPAEERVQVSDRTEGFFRIITRFGFMESPHIDEVIRASKEAGLVIQRERATFFVGKERIVASATPGMALWREHLFVFLSKHSENAADFFQLPPDRVYEVSQVVEI
ncbi:MAG TPA: KUP/HAK/KT family potassium transporter [Chthoniobacterales bacterium]|jgi:KUP system potassium uptake protein